MDYRTTDFGGRGVWGLSLRQWSNFMRVVPVEGISVTELTRRSRARPALDGMRRWRYVTLDSANTTVTPTKQGLRAQEVWRPLPDEIEARWRERIGSAEINALRAALETAVARIGDGYPDWLTGIYGGFAAAPQGSEKGEPRVLPLSALLSVPLHGFTLLYEREAGASLQYTANILRLLDREGVPIAELPRRSGVAMPALTSALGILRKGGFVEQTTGRGRVVRLTEQGAAELELYASRPAEIEDRFGGEGRVRAALEAVLCPDAPLWPRLDPPPGSWRSKLEPPEVLPHHPIPRQGGHPDGV